MAGRVGRLEIAGLWWIVVAGAIQLALPSACRFDGGLQEKVECVRNDECDPGQFCLNGTCASNISCILNTDCPPEMICVNATCVPESDLGLDARDFGDDPDGPIDMGDDRPEDPIADADADDPDADPDADVDADDMADVAGDAGDVASDLPADVADDLTPDVPSDLAEGDDGGAVLVVATFDELPVTAVDGAQAIVTDLDDEAFRYSADLSRWIFAWFYEMSPVVDNRLAGDVTPANEAIPWTQNTTGGGSIAVEEGRVVLDNTEVNEALAFAYYVHGTDSESHWIAGEFSLTDSSGSSFLRHAVDVRDLQRAAVVNLENGADGIRIVNGGDVSIGTATGTESAATPRFIELFVFQGDRVELYVDHELLQTAPYTSLAPSSWNAYVVGNQRTTGSGVTTVRDAAFGRFEP